MLIKTNWKTLTKEWLGITCACGCWTLSISFSFLTHTKKATKNRHLLRSKVHRTMTPPLSLPRLNLILFWIFLGALVSIALSVLWSPRFDHHRQLSLAIRSVSLAYTSRLFMFLQFASACIFGFTLMTRLIRFSYRLVIMNSWRIEGRLVMKI